MTETTTIISNTTSKWSDGVLAHILCKVRAIKDHQVWRNRVVAIRKIIVVLTDVKQEKENKSNEV